MKKSMAVGKIDWYPSLNLYMMNNATHRFYDKAGDARYRNEAHFIITNKEESNAE